MTNFDIIGGKTFLRMMFVVGLSAVAAAALIVGVMIGVNDTGTPLIGSDRWFIFYMFPVIFVTLLITIYMYRLLAQEKITFNY